MTPNKTNCSYSMQETRRQNWGAGRRFNSAGLITTYGLLEPLSGLLFVAVGSEAGALLAVGGGAKFD